jgi:hypothetical protein
MMARVVFEDRKIVAASVQFVRHNDDNETFVSPMAEEKEITAKIIDKSALLGGAVDIQRDCLRLSMPDRT